MKNKKEINDYILECLNSSNNLDFNSQLRHIQQLITYNLIDKPAEDEIICKFEIDIKKDVDSKYFPENTCISVMCNGVKIQSFGCWGAQENIDEYTKQAQQFIDSFKKGNK